MLLWSCPLVCHQCPLQAHRCPKSVLTVGSAAPLRSHPSAPLCLCIAGLNLCPDLLLLPSFFPSIWVFFNESALHMRWPKYCSFSFSISPSNEGLVDFLTIHGWFPLGLTGWISLQSKKLSRVLSNTTVQKHQFFGTEPSLQSNSHIHRVNDTIQPFNSLSPPSPPALNLSQHQGLFQWVSSAH